MICARGSGIRVDDMPQAREHWHANPWFLAACDYAERLYAITS